MSIDSYSKLAGTIEDALDEADEAAKNTTKRLSHEEVFSKLRKIAKGEEVQNKIPPSVL